MTKPLVARYQLLVQTLLTLLEARNPYNLDHCRLVAHYCDKLGRRMQLEPARREILKRAAEVHTLGVHLQMEEKKIQQNLPITNLGLRTGREGPIHQREDEIFMAVLGDIPEYAECIPLLQQRHEFFDGTGSLHGLSGNSILLEARVLAVVDAFVDLATPKAHRPPESIAEVAARLSTLSGTQFDPCVVEALLSMLVEEEGHWGASARSQQFENSRGYHYLGLGHFYAQVHETPWALRSYAKAERIAVSTENYPLELEAVAGQFLVFIDMEELEQARDSLNRFRKGSHLGGAGHTLAQLYWGLLEWLQGRSQTGQQLLEAVAQRCQEQRDLVGLSAALAFQAAMLLFHEGSQDPDHLEYLQRFLDLVSHHDVFDVVERYRPQTVPLLLSGMVNHVHSALCRNLLTRLGEPCQGPLYDRLREIPPRQWMKVLACEGAPETVDQPAAQALQGKELWVTLSGPFSLQMGEKTLELDAFPSQKASRLLALLAIHRGGVQDEVLLETLWPDSTPENGRNSLRNTLHQVRQTLKQFAGDECRVERSRKSGRIQWVFPYQTDCEAFEKKLQLAQQAHAQGDFAAALVSLRDALGLLRGGYLDGFDDEFVTAPRVFLNDQRLQSLLLQARIELGLGNPEACEITVRGVLALDDLCEEAHLLRLESLAMQQRYAEMARCYKFSQEHFQKELGITPHSLEQALNRLTCKDAPSN